MASAVSLAAIFVDSGSLGLSGHQLDLTEPTDKAEGAALITARQRQALWYDLDHRTVSRVANTGTQSGEAFMSPCCF